MGVLDSICSIDLPSRMLERISTRRLAVIGAAWCGGRSHCALHLCALFSTFVYPVWVAGFSFARLWLGARIGAAVGKRTFCICHLLDHLRIPAEVPLKHLSEKEEDEEESPKTPPRATMSPLA